MLLALFLALAGEAPATPPLAIGGDFDRDGRRDLARVVPAQAGGHVLEVARGGGRPVAVYRLPRLEGFEMRKAKRGVVATACAKGLGRRSQPCPRKTVHVFGDVIEFGFAEGALAVAPWTGKGFDVVWISD